MLKQMRPAVVSVLMFTVLTGLLIPAAVTGIARLAFPHQAGGSLVTVGGNVIGSELIGQPFTAPDYFHPRPSAAGCGYDAAASGGTNLGPTSDKLINGVADDPATKDTDESYMGVKQLAAGYRTENGLAPDTALPADAVTRSASGLDPHISPANALLQARRVARAHNLSEPEVRRLVAAHTEARALGVLGEARVNVLRLNLALDSLAGAERGKG